jgi:hypothetical protein
MARVGANKEVSKKIAKAVKGAMSGMSSENKLLVRRPATAPRAAPRPDPTVSLAGRKSARTIYDAPEPRTQTGRGAQVEKYQTYISTKKNWVHDHRLGVGDFYKNDDACWPAAADCLRDDESMRDGVLVQNGLYPSIALEKQLLEVILNLA